MGIGIKKVKSIIITIFSQLNLQEIKLKCIGVSMCECVNVCIRKTFYIIWIYQSILGKIIQNLRKLKII